MSGIPEISRGKLFNILGMPDTANQIDVGSFGSRIISYCQVNPIVSIALTVILVAALIFCGYKYLCASKISEDSTTNQANTTIKQEQEKLKTSEDPQLETKKPKLEDRKAQLEVRKAQLEAKRFQLETKRASIAQKAANNNLTDAEKQIK